MQTKTINQQTELITQNMFSVQTFSSMTEKRLDALKAVICKIVQTTWLDIKRIDNQTVSVILETTDNVDDVSDTIADIIQKGSMI